MEFILVMNAKPDQNIFDEVAIIMAIEPAYVEKDWYVRFNLPHKKIKSLSAIYGTTPKMNF